MKSGLIITNAYYTSEAFDAQCARLTAEFSALGVAVAVRANDFFPAGVFGGEIKSAVDCDFIIYLDKDSYVSEMLGRSGTPVFNSAGAIAVCDDKMATHIALAGYGLPMPPTLPGLLCYNKNEKIKPETVDRVADTLGYPVIIKECRNSLGAGVYRADDREKLETVMEKLKCRPHLFQKYIASSYGRDVRVIVVGGEALGGMLRKSGQGFRANISAGGKGECYDITGDAARYAEKAADVLGLDYAGVDFLIGERGELILSEVNSNALFIEFEKVTGINVAKALAGHILQKIN